MMVHSKTGAPKNKPNLIDKHEAIVKRLQQRIVKAVKENKTGKVKALTRLLVTSHSAKLIAIERVTSNKGKHTPGVDGVTWHNPTLKQQALQSLNRRGYRAQRLKRCYIKKKNGKLRPLSIPTMKDRAMQALYLLALQPVAETTADPDSYGFRTGRSTHDAIEQIVIDLTAGGHNGHWILEGDIKACFDEISHQWLSKNIPMDKYILHQWLQAGYMDKGKRFPTTQGTPQGGIASPTLSNMTLDGMEAIVTQTANKAGCKTHFVRYADDFVVISNDKDRLISEIKPAIEKFLEARGLQLSQEKTLITHINQGFDFLGKNIRKYNGKLIVKPSKDSIKSVTSKVKEVINTIGGHCSVYQLKAILNPRLRGWGNYHRFGSSSKSFNNIDYRVFHMLYAWALRRHPNKGKRWVYKRYFEPNHGFFNQWDRSKRRKQNPKLVKLSSLGIKRYIKVRKQANPFDSDWENYFSNRKQGHIYR